MASPNDIVCADIERHIKALLLHGSNEQTTPKKGGQRNKKYEENFPQLAPGRSPGPLPNHLQSARTPNKPSKSTPSRGAAQQMTSSNPECTPEVNGYDYFQGKEIVTFKPDSTAFRSPVSTTKVENSLPDLDSKAFVQNSSARQLEQLWDEEALDNGDQNTPGRQSNPKQKKRVKKKKEKKEQPKKEQQKVDPKSLLSKLTVQKVAEAEVQSSYDAEQQKRNRNKPVKGRELDCNSAQFRLMQEIMKEKQAWRNHHNGTLEERLARVDVKLKKYLETEWLFPLEKASARFPDALFYCRVCNYHCDMDNYQRHIKQNNHVTMKTIKDGEVFLQNMPYPSEAQCEAISKILQDVAEKHGFSPEDFCQRQDVADRLTKRIQEKGLLDCKFQIFGSSLSGFATKDSDLNMDFIYTAQEGLPVVLRKLQEILKDDDCLIDVNTDLEAKMPKIFFKDSITGLKCDISWNSIGTVQTSRLLCRYRTLDPRVHVLGVAFRMWAKMCEIDHQERGTLPPHSYAILLVYFLQQVRPAVLPVLHEVEPNMDPENPPIQGTVTGKWKCLNNMTVGELWIELFRFYGLTFNTVDNVVSLRFRKKITRTEKKWPGKVIAVEDPYIRKRNLSRCIPNTVVFRYIQERFRETYRYFGVPQTTGGPLFEKLNSDVLGKARKGRPIELSSESSDASSQDEEDGENKDRQAWRRRRKHSENAREGNDFDGHDSSSSDDELMEDHDQDITMDDLRIIASLDLGESGDDRQGRTESESSDACLQLPDPDPEQSVHSSSLSPSRKNATPSKTSEKVARKRPDSPPCQYIIELMKSFEEADLDYRFEKNIFTDNKSPPVYCSMCGEEKHLKDNCPTQILPELVPLIPLPPNYLRKLDQACMQVMKDNAPSKRETDARQALLTNLQDHIRSYYPDANLELFGSSCNGFVFAGSDMDICLTFTDKKGETFDHAEIIEKLAQNLETHGLLQNILPITTAKVPIVKFNYRKLNVECDISLYNTLAQHNTRMLLAYCNIDPRVQQLGYTMKLFAKLCDIGDASRGSLSSYAYILMVIYFLQQRDPPVIPVLQELFPKDQTPPQLMVDGWNAWFYQDINNLSSVWPEHGKNKESIGELWVGLLRFYTEEFNFKEHVVCIRQKSLLTRIEKVWNAKIICIEDPFDLNHNLGVGVSRKMSIYIMKALIRGRELFGTPYDTDNKILKKFLFDSHKLVVEAPPNDRGCRACGKIGHKVKDCPFRRNTRPSQQNRRQDQSQQQQQQYAQHNRHRVGTVGEMRQDQGRMQAKLEGNSLFNQNNARFGKLMVRPIPLRHFQEQQQQHPQQQHHHHHQQLQHGHPIKKQKPQHMQLHKQQVPQHGSPNPNRGNNSYSDNKPSEGGNFCGPLPVGVHPMHRLPMPPSASPPWPNSSPRPNIGLASPQPGLLPPPVLERTPRHDNQNPAPPSSPIQAMPPTSHSLPYFQGNGTFPFGFQIGTTVPTMSTQTNVHNVLYSQQQSRTPPKPVGREEPQMMCRPPVPPAFTHSMWVVNGPVFPQNSPQPPPQQPILSPNSPMRPMVIPGSQVMGSPQVLLGSSPQQVAALSPLMTQFQHKSLNPENCE